MNQLWNESCLTGANGVEYSHWPQHNQLLFSPWGHRNWQLIWRNGCYSQSFLGYTQPSRYSMDLVWGGAGFHSHWKDCCSHSEGWVPMGNLSQQSHQGQVSQSCKVLGTITAVQTAPVPLVAQNFSNMNKNGFGDLNPRGPASWVKKKMDWRVNAGSWELNTYDIMCLTNTSIQSWSEIISFSLPLMFFFFLSSNT